MSLKKFNFKKKFGQNFLVNKDICSKIVKLANINEKSNVLEIGPGAGALTNFIYQLNFSNLTLVEKDKELIENLSEKFPKAEIINQDALFIKIFDIFKKTNKKVTIIGNLPYNIGTILALNWLEEFDFIEKIVIMLQAEVAERFTAKENSKEYGIPTVLLQKYFNIEIKINVSPNNFFPKPQVDSSVMLLQPKSNVIFDKEKFHYFKKFTSFAFQNRRKKIKFALNKILEELEKSNKEISFDKQKQKRQFKKPEENKELLLKEMQIFSKLLNSTVVDKRIENLKVEEIWNLIENN